VPQRGVVPGRDRPGTRRDGRQRVRALQGQRPPDPGVQHQQARRDRPHSPGRAHRHHRPMTPKTTGDVLKAAKAGMDKTMESTRREFSSIRTGKATTSLLDLVRVDAYGNSMPLNQVGTVAAPEPRLLTITPWDKGLIKAIEKGITESDLGLNPA